MKPSSFTQPGYRVTADADLTHHNSFRVPARAQWLIEVDDARALPEVFGLGAVKRSPLLILGEGSNVLLTRDWPGVVLAVAARGIRVLEDRGDDARMRVEAGENWNEFVHWSLGHGFAGLENLILIPGSVGAAPIQNIGAYGVEVREFIETIEAFDRHSGQLGRLDNAVCNFAYRDSLFKRDPDRFVVTSVEFRLPRQHELRLDYAGVREELAAMKIDAPNPAALAEAVMRLRTRKLPNPAEIGNAGSFFKNPVVPSALANELRRENPALPAWLGNAGQCKLSAAWLVEACGFKGLREGDAGVSERHALVLVNHGTATGEQIRALAQRVVDTVQTRFGIRLEPEPRIV
ncbi:MAG: UDP-N-acetylmuramate dehydrogenase [Xanthomonadaceae bacterium]|nr:UDP-N-acetylmuramate dehydrogenase [Xanthomonadaceae bacterium]MDE2257516.1 UDP-N-acetylmuramate dehydrogenase [Xanthomonadaceae bacterium]